MAVTNSAFFYNDLVLSATITVTSAATTYPYTKALNNYRGSKWRSTTIAAQTWTFDFGAAVNAEAIFIDGSNMVSGDTTFTFQSGSTAAAVDYGPVPLDKDTKSFKELSPGAAYRYAKVIATKASGSYTEWGKIAILSEVYDFDKMYRDKLPQGFADMNFFSRSNRGHVSKKYFDKRYEKQMQFDFVTETQNATFDETIRSLDPEFLVFWDSQREEAFYGTVSFETPVPTRDKYSIFGIFEEAV